MKLTLLLTLLSALFAAWIIFHFKAQLGLLMLPLFLVLVAVITLILYRLMEKDDPEQSD
ncbi:hypothetical protein N9W21_00165 [Shewanella sp.]|nr:hypothetical protein [Shewanella sp.]